MAVGGGLYPTAIFATGLILGVLSLLGFLERFMSLKVMVYCYEVTCGSAEQATLRVNEILEPLHLMTENVQIAPTPRHVRVRFELASTRKRQNRILATLRDSKAFESVTALGPVQAE